MQNMELTGFNIISLVYSFENLYIKIIHTVYPEVDVFHAWKMYNYALILFKEIKITFRNQKVEWDL